MVDTEFSPDYRGLADMLGFEAIQIQNFWERNPSDTLFMEWARCQDSTLLSPVLGTLVDCLERLGRRDVLEDCRGLICKPLVDSYRATVFVDTALPLYQLILFFVT